MYILRICFITYFHFVELLTPAAGYYTKHSLICFMKKLLIIGAIAAAACCAVRADACTRVVYLGAANDVIMVGRTLDWKTPIPTNIYVYPRGIRKESFDKGKRLTWTSRYGSVIAVSYDGGVTEGMNERGLTMNGLFCKLSEYTDSGTLSHNLPQMSLSMIISYFIDNFVTVDEVDQWLRQNPFVISAKTFDGGTVPRLHFGLTDLTGETLIMEWDAGHLYTYRGRDLKVLTNDPVFPKMQAIEEYWKGIGGTAMLPGTVRSADRFVRATFFINNVPDNYDTDLAWGSLSSIMGTVSVPYGYMIEGDGNVSSTQWRTIADMSNGKYYMRFADSKSDFWIDLGRLQLNDGAPILKLVTSDHNAYQGCANQWLKPTPGFTPMY